MRRSRLLASSALVLSLVTGLTVGLPPVPVFAADGQPPELPVSTSPLLYKPPVLPRMPQSPPVVAPVWPSAGSVLVDLRAAGTPASLVDGGVGVAGGVSPGGLPVRVTVPGSSTASLEEVEQRWLRGLPTGVAPLQISAVQVSTFDQKASDALGLKGVLLSLTNSASSVAGSAPVHVTVGYGGFANAFGGNFADRLRLVVLPACAVTTPSLPACQVQVPVSQATNDTALDVVSAVVDLGSVTSGVGPASRSASDATVGGAGSVLVAVLAGPSSETGDWSATPLPQAANWQAGSSGGDFTYSVPIDVPASPGGLAPRVSVGYSSGSVDGLSKSKNSQASWVGEGWDYHPGYVERSYRPCIRDGEGATGGGNLCWVAESPSQLYSPVTVVLNGTSTRLVETAANGWKAEDDSAGWRVEHLTAVANGAGEAFKVTTRDGTQYLFGSKPAAEFGGVLQVEVYGNNVGEPCYNAGGFHLSHCTKPYRWNLDRVVDVHGNVMDLRWWRHRGSYGGVGSDVFPYDIHGRLTAIEYGSNQVTGTGHTHRVVFGALNRCLSGQSSCALSEYLDVPWDQFCAEAATSCAQQAPTFWNMYRLGSIDTQVRAGSSWNSVRRWDFEQTFPPHADSTSPSLWLQKVIRPGFVNAMEFGGIDPANRVDVGTGKPATQHYRISEVTTGTGSLVKVAYSGPDCTPTSLPGASDFNPKRCYPDSDNGTLSWWHKYVVTQVDVEDRVGVAPGVPGLTERFQYTYSTLGSSTTTLWKHDRDWHEQPMYRTWSVWAGYPMVETKHSAADETGPVQVSEDLFYRGMDDDWTAAVGAGGRSVDLIDGAVSYTDKLALAGQVARSRVYDGPVNVDRSNWVSATTHLFNVTATGTFTFNGGPNPPIYATRVRETETKQVKVSSGPTLRETRTLTDYETGYGLPVKVTDMGSTASAADDRCTITDYAPANTTVWLIGLPKQAWTTNCATTPAAADVLAAARTHYDALGYGVMPTRGLATVGLAAPHVTTYPLSVIDFDQQFRSTYDQHGRALDSFDALDRQTTTGYTPATGGPVTRTTVTGPLINSVRWDTITDLDPTFGVPTKVTDTNGKVTVAQYDTVGRLSKVWKEHRAPGDDTTGITPDLEYTYNLGAPAFVSTKTLKPDGGQLQSWEIYDGLLRPRQAQALSATTAGTAIADTRYNGIGQIDKTSTVYSSAAPSSTLQTVLDKDAKVQQRFVYDNLGRVTSTQQWEGNTTTASMLWETVAGYDGEKTATLTPPAGGIATTTIKDVRGNVIELRQHAGATPASPVATTTTYFYDRLDQLTQVEDTAGNDWFYNYDLLGRKTSTIDPDAGTSITNFDPAGQISSTTDGRGQKLFHEYDTLGRKTRTRQDSATGATRATWTYDSLAGVTVAKDS